MRIKLMSAGVVALGVVLWLVACDRRQNVPAQTGPSLRIVSVSPALTQMIVDLGASASLVGVAENDAAAPPGLPTVGNFLKINTEALLAVQPTHVMMTHGKDGVPAHMKKLADRRSFHLISYAYPQSIVAVGNILYEQNNPECVSSVLNRSAFGQSLRNSGFYHRLGQINQLVGDRRRPRVLMVINTDPLTASGRKTVLDDLLNFMLRGENAVGDVNHIAPILDREMLLKAAPDVIILLTPNKPPLEAIDFDPRLAIFRGMNIPAVKNRRVVLINDPLVQLPSTSLVRVGIAMAKAIHMDLTEQLDQLLEPPAEESEAESRRSHRDQGSSYS